MNSKPTSDVVTLRRVLGLFSCTLLVIGNMIGVGIFTTPGSVAAKLPMDWLILLAWVIGAFLAICGALSYAELGAMYPQAGGNYVFLREAYGPLWGFLYGWTAAFITQAGTIAVLAIGFTEYAGIHNPHFAKSIAVSLIIFFGALNYIGVRSGSLGVNIITSLKIGAILLFVLLGFTLGKPTELFLHAEPTTLATMTLWTALATALIPIMYTYSGWNATVYVGGEVKDPQRTIPFSLLLGVGITATLYFLLNTLYLYAIPATQMKNVVAIASDTALVLFGVRAQHIIAGLIALSVLGCINATLLTAPRIPFAMAQDGYFFSVFKLIHPRFQTPAFAILLITVWACFLVLTGSFDQLLTYVTFPSLLINTLTVSSIFVLRKTKPEMQRPYRAWGYPVLPFLFVMMIAWILISVLIENPKDAMTGVSIVALGIPFFLYFKRSKN